MAERSIKHTKKQERRENTNPAFSQTTINYYTMKKMRKTILSEIIKALFTLGLSLLKKGKKYHVNNKDTEKPPKNNTPQKRIS